MQVAQFLSNGLQQGTDYDFLPQTMERNLHLFLDD
jgi:hypothetical protein